MSKLSFQTVHECKEIFQAASDELAGLAAGSLGDICRLQYAFEDFWSGTRFESYWTQNQIENLTVEQYAKDVFQENQNLPGSVEFDKQIDELKSNSAVAQEKLLELARYAESQLIRVAIEINGIHKPFFRNMFGQAYGFMDQLALYYQGHQGLGLTLGKDTGDQGIWVKIKEILNLRGLHAVNKFLDGSDLFHTQLKSQVKDLKRKQIKDYENFTGLSTIKLEQEANNIENLRQTLTQVIAKVEQDKSSKENILEQLSQLVVDSRQAVQKALVLIVNESSKLTKNSLEVIEYGLIGMSRVLFEIKTFADQAGYSGNESMISSNPLTSSRISVQPFEYIYTPSAVARLLKDDLQSQIEPQVFTYKANAKVQSLQEQGSNYFSQWYSLIAGYLKPYNNLLGDAEVDENSELQSLELPAALINIVNFNIEDIAAMRTNKYEARITRFRIPMQGTIWLSRDFLIFYGNQIGDHHHLLIPYKAITEVWPLKNFLLQGNGLSLKTIFGDVTLYVENKTNRDDIGAKLSMNCQAESVIQSSVFGQTVSYRQLNHNPQVTDLPEYNILLVPKRYQGVARSRVLRIERALHLKLYKFEDAKEAVNIPRCKVHQLIDSLFGTNEQPISVLGKWRDNCGFKLSGDPTIHQRPEYLSLDPVEEYEEMYYNFLTGPLVEQVLTSYMNSADQKVQEVDNIYYSQVDQVLVLFTAATASGVCWVLYCFQQVTPSDVTVYRAFRGDFENNQELYKVYGDQLIKTLAAEAQRLADLQSEDQSEDKVNKEDAVEVPLVPTRTNQSAKESPSKRSDLQGSGSKSEKSLPGELPRRQDPNKSLNQSGELESSHQTDLQNSLATKETQESVVTASEVVREKEKEDQVEDFSEVIQIDSVDTLDKDSENKDNISE